MKKTTVLLTGSGGPGGPGIIKSLHLAKTRKIRVIATDMEKTSIADGLADVFYVVPPAKDSGFIKAILKIAKKEKVEVILPLNTGELEGFAQNRNIFEKENIKISICSSESLQIANSKYLLMSHCQRINVAVPEFYLVKSLPEFLEKVTKLGYPLKKVCIKPPISNGSRGFRVLDATINKMDIFLHQKPTQVEATLEELVAILKPAKEFPELLVMEYLPGQEYSVDALADNGKPFMVVPRTRDKIKMGVSFASTLVEEKNIIVACQKVIKSLKLNGNVGFQFKKDEKGIARLIESNPRLQGTIVVNTAGGANLPVLAVEVALGEKVKIPKVAWGTKMIRFWDETYYKKNGQSFNL